MGGRNFHHHHSRIVTIADVDVVFQVLLKRSLTPESRFVSCHGSSYDRDLFLIIWGPTVAALSYVYDNGVEKSVVQKALGGFR